MKNSKSLMTIIVLSVVAALASGCSIASIQSRPGEYSMNGYSTSPEMAAQVMSENYVNEMNARKYWEAVERGDAHPYPGGGYGNDYGLYFGQYGYPGVAPDQPVAPNGGVTPQDLERVEGKANDALRMHKKLRQRLEQPSGEQD
jgi:hypothetical protein